MKSLALAFAAGLVFGLGLLLSGMTLPSKVIGFLQLTEGWDPSLAFVMVGAIGVHALAYRFVPRLKAPLFAAAFTIPTRAGIDARLVVGGALFGLGWALSGYCPGPAVLAAGSLGRAPLVFVACMMVGMFAHNLTMAKEAT